MSREALVGGSLAGYQIRSMVGEGGTSAVYRADHPTHGTVALKVLREKLRHDRTAVARFVREAQYGGRVVHPNVVRTIEIGEAPLTGALGEVPGIGDVPLHFLAIEWAGGEILEKYAKRHGPLPADEVARIVVQIADAVQAAHDAGIVHRDLKPENVMYDPATGQVKLLDFGIATSADQGADERLTRAGFFVGTLMYVAPEALSGEMVTATADQYSLATIAYFLLSACHPYAGKTPREMFQQLLTQPPTPLHAVREGLVVPPNVEAVIMRGLAKTPAERYPDVRTFAREFAAAVAASPAPAAAETGLFGKLKGMFKR